MLRESSSVVYTSLPQEEGGGSARGGNNNNIDSSSRNSMLSGGAPFITTSRSKNTRHSRRDCQLTSLIMALVVICGVTLAVLLPMALKHKATSDASGLRDVMLSDVVDGTDDDGGSSVGILSSGEHDNGESDSGSNNRKEGTTGKETVLVDGSSDESHQDNVDTSTGNQGEVEEGDGSGSSSGGSQEKATDGNGSGIPLPSLITVVTTTTTTTPPPPLPTLRLTTIPIAPETQPPPPEPIETTNKNETLVILPSSLPGSSDKEGQINTEKNNMGSGDVNSGEGGTSSVESGYSSDSILKEIYGNEDDSFVKPTPTQSFGGWMNEFMSQHDQATLVVMIVLVAVAAAMVVTAVAWLIHQRVSSRRRRINIQSVITDLQSRDKVVLLNSEDSDEEQ